MANVQLRVTVTAPAPATQDGERGERRFGAGALHLEVPSGPSIGGWPPVSANRTLGRLQHRAATLSFELLNREIGEIVAAGVS